VLAQGRRVAHITLENLHGNRTTLGNAQQPLTSARFRLGANPGIPLGSHRIENPEPLGRLQILM